MVVGACIFVTLNPLTAESADVSDSAPKPYASLWDQNFEFAKTDAAVPESVVPEAGSEVAVGTKVPGTQSPTDQASESADFKYLAVAELAPSQVLLVNNSVFPRQGLDGGFPRFSMFSHGDLPDPTYGSTRATSDGFLVQISNYSRLLGRPRLLADRSQLVTPV